MYNKRVKLEEIKNIVIQGYRDVLKREPGTSGLEDYINRLRKGLSIEEFYSILRSEHKNRFETKNIIDKNAITKNIGQIQKDIVQFKEGQKVVIASIIRDEEKSGNLARFLDCCRELEQYHNNIIYIFIEGDSSDRTYEKLKEWIGQRNGSILEKIDKGHSPFGKTKDKKRTICLAELRNRLIEHILSIPNIGEILVIDANYGWKGDIITSLRKIDAHIAAPLVFMHKDSHGKYIFYDIWVFRKNGKEFLRKYPYTEDMRLDMPVDVDSVGSGYLVKRQVFEEGVKYIGNNDSEQVGFCNNARSLGFSIKINPNVCIIKGGYKE